MASQRILRRVGISLSDSHLSLLITSLDPIPSSVYPNKHPLTLYASLDDNSPSLLVGEATAHPKVTNEPESVMPFVIVVSAVLLALITFLVKYGLGGSLKDEL